MLKAIKRRVKRLVTKIYDPLVTISIGTEHIKVPLSHQLNENISVYPDYNFNLPRIVKYVSEHVNDVKVIDIGANIGDTVAFIKNYTDTPILCIDGEKKYIDILIDNVAQYKNVKVCHSLVGEITTENNMQLVMERGTAFVTEGKEKNKIRSLENILQEYSEFNNSKILKVDTDGFDTFIIRGCSNYLKKEKPILFFEYDPYLIRKNNDDPFQFISYLEETGYKYLMFYMNNGDFLLSCEIQQREIIDQLIHYFSGRNIDMFADICAFHANDKHIFESCVALEVQHFKQARKY